MIRIRPVVARMHGAWQWLSTPAGERLKRWASVLLSLFILLTLAQAIGEIGWRDTVAVVPASPWFWLTYVAAYFIHPFADHLIYRRWWGFGWPAISVFLKKRVVNSALFSYAGETWFIGWAMSVTGYRLDPDAEKLPITARGDGPGLNPATNPLAAIKDVNLTSGLTGNFFTMAMLLLAIVMGGGGLLLDSFDEVTLWRASASFIILMLLSLSLLVFRRRVMSLPSRDNIWSGTVNLVRVVGQHLLIVASWMIAIPDVGFDSWMLLGAVRLVIMRLPLPNREILFASVAVALAGPLSTEIAALMAAQGVIYLLLHLFAWLLAEAIEWQGRLAESV